MLDTMTDDSLADQLLRIASDPDLRQSVYGRLGDYCHQCRNRLNSLKLSLFLAIREAPEAGSGAWVEIERQYLELERRVDRVQTICRPMTLSRVTIGLDLLVDDRREDWSRWMLNAGSELEFQPPRERAVASFDVEKLGQALDAVVAWRAGVAGPGRTARLRWGIEAGRAFLSWEESGQGIDRPAGPAPDPGATWTLPLLARIVEAHGGRYGIEVDRSWQLVASWPCVPSTP